MCQYLIHFICLAVTILHSMLLNDGVVVFSLFKILFKFSRFNFCSCDRVCSGLFCCAVFGWLGFPFSEIGGSFRMCCVCLIIFDVPGNVLLLPCWSFIFWWISKISGSENQPFFTLVLTWSASLTSCLKIRMFLPDLHHSFPISSLCRVTPKIAV